MRGGSVACALASLLLAAACGAPRSDPEAPSAPPPVATTGGGDAASTAAPPAPALVADIEAMVAEPAAGERGELHSLAAELATDWTREAGTDRDAADVLALLRRELADRLAAARGAELDALRAEVCDRRARELSRRSLTLGQAVIDGAIDDDAARAAGRQILREVAALMPQVRALRDAERARVLSGDLQEVSLEASFAVDRGAMSRRLSDYRATRTAPGPR